MKGNLIDFVFLIHFLRHFEDYTPMLPGSVVIVGIVRLQEILCWVVEAVLPLETLDVLLVPALPVPTPPGVPSLLPYHPRFALETGLAARV